MIVTIVGAGNMARGIATRALAGGHQVRLVDRTAAKAENLAMELSDDTGGTATGGSSLDEGATGAAVVVLAVPYPAGREVIQQLPQTHPVVVDISNPVDFTTFDSLVVPPGVSAAEEIAAENPGARLVKAFNTTFASTLVAGEVDGRPLDVFLASDDDGAKETVAKLVRDGGLRPLDAGALRRARELEAFQFLVMTMQDRLGLGWSSAVKILP
ncbi:NADPH-dependent F420 reductase [Nocardiopsis sp. YSL2]|uniref:NADPH-dependent F420 reductase n=1 Tax=Nocardiopsis sp. YSL2 TaxID=2939492 RepID=UPI0026F43010|nr:NADPH-dependent F420 reductase [Nocardiopsis sp. YSL2]